METNEEVIELETTLENAGKFKPIENPITKLIKYFKKRNEK